MASKTLCADSELPCTDRPTDRPHLNVLGVCLRDPPPSHLSGVVLSQTSSFSPSRDRRSIHHPGRVLSPFKSHVCVCMCVCNIQYNDYFNIYYILYVYYIVLISLILFIYLYSFFFLCFNYCTFNIY